MSDEFTVGTSGPVTDNLPAVRESFEAKGLDPVLWAQSPVFAFAYFPVPPAGHYVEHIRCFGDGGAFLASVREPSTEVSGRRAIATLIATGLRAIVRSLTRLFAALRRPS